MQRGQVSGCSCVTSGGLSRWPGTRLAVLQLCNLDDVRLRLHDPVFPADAGIKDPILHIAAAREARHDCLHGATAATQAPERGFQGLCLRRASSKSCSSEQQRDVRGVTCRMRILLSRGLQLVFACESRVLLLHSCTRQLPVPLPDFLGAEQHHAELRVIYAREVPALTDVQFEACMGHLTVARHV